MSDLTNKNKKTQKKTSKKSSVFGSSQFPTTSGDLGCKDIASSSISRTSPFKQVDESEYSIGDNAGNLAKLMGILRNAGRYYLNSGIGEATQEEADICGRSWVGKDYIVASDGTSMVSADGLRQYRPRSYKPRWNVYQANFESRFVPKGKWRNNAHLVIVDK